MMFFEGYDDAKTRSLVSGKRFTVVYRITGDEENARRTAADICGEQTVEFPLVCLPPGAIPEELVGRIERFEPEAGQEPPAGRTSAPPPPAWHAEISFAYELAAGEFTQFLNVVFGNISIKRNIQVIGIKPGACLDGVLTGPRYGVEGIRRLVGVHDRPLVFSAIKPMGLSAKDMGKLAGVNPFRKSSSTMEKR